jgi:beta-N-acetylhexosaminidase
VDEIVISQRPSTADIAAIRDRISQYDLIVIGTTSAHLQREQAILANQLLTMDVPMITVALRTPYDLTVYPAAQTYICTYGIQPVSLNALAAGLFGAIPFSGRLPVTLPDDLAA